MPSKQKVEGKSLILGLWLEKCSSESSFGLFGSQFGRSKHQIKNLERGLKDLDSPNKLNTLNNQLVGCSIEAGTSRDPNIYMEHCLNVCLGGLNHGQGFQANDFNWDKEGDEPSNKRELWHPCSHYNYKPWEVSDACRPQLTKEELHNNIRDEERAAYQTLKPTTRALWNVLIEAIQYHGVTLTLSREEGHERVEWRRKLEFSSLVKKIQALKWVLTMEWLYHYEWAYSLMHQHLTSYQRGQVSKLNQG